MKISSFSFFIVGLLVCVSFGFRPSVAVYQFDYENVLGTSFQLKVAASSEQRADDAEQMALKEIDRLAAILSTYNPSSEISQWQKTRNVEVEISPELFEVLHLFDDWKQRTSGALSASIGTASNLWKQAEATQRMPNMNALSTAVNEMKQQPWRLNEDSHTAIHLSDQPLVLNSFVKSYIIRKVSDRLMNLAGVTGVVVNVGGDMVIAGSQTEKVRIANPIADAENDNPTSLIIAHDKAIATSGNYRRGFQIGDQWFSHIIDPRTGVPASSVASATVVAESATDAGALATAFNILSLEESKTLAAQIPGVEYQIVTKDGEEVESEGWKAMEVKNVISKSGTAIAQDQGKLTVGLELATFEGRFRRPFIAVWIENKKKESVKTVALWYNKPRWLPDLKRWYSKRQPDDQAGVSMESISSATRSAGKYTLTWDGLDDNGKVVPSGTYTVYIEAAREHGTYQLIKQEINWNGKPKHFDLKGGVEITAASLDIAK